MLCRQIGRTRIKYTNCLNIRFLFIYTHQQNANSPLTIYIYHTAGDNRNRDFNRKSNKNALKSERCRHKRNIHWSVGMFNNHEFLFIYKRVKQICIYLKKKKKNTLKIVKVFHSQFFFFLICRKLIFIFIFFFLFSFIWHCFEFVLAPHASSVKHKILQKVFIYSYVRR